MAYKTWCERCDNLCTVSEEVWEEIRTQGYHTRRLLCERCKVKGETFRQLCNQIEEKEKEMRLRCILKISHMCREEVEEFRKMVEENESFASCINQLVKVVESCVDMVEAVVGGTHGQPDTPRFAKFVNL